MVNSLYGGIVESEFELHLRNYFQFRTNIHGRGMNSRIPVDIG